MVDTFMQEITARKIRSLGRVGEEFRCLADASHG
jgi:hypothetical protein